MGLDLTSDPKRSANNISNSNAGSARSLVPGARSSGASSDSASRKFVGMKFNCCSVYTRIYVNRDGTAYEGRCPKCGKPVRLKIGEGGTNNRFFETS
ncbi:MAG: hypothetical protein ACRC46_06080 [Thermoguttaceae bacterium]